MWEKEQAIARRVHDLGGEVGYGEWRDSSRTAFGRCEQSLLEKLFGAKYFLRVEAVNLDRTTTTVEDFQDLGLPELEQLEILHLYGCRDIHDGIGPHLCQLRTLRILTLSHTAVGDDTVMKLKALTALEELRLQGVNAVSPETIQEVEKWPGLTLLRWWRHGNVADNVKTEEQNVAADVAPVWLVEVLRVGTVFG
jgi:hypothetical protein